MAATLEQLLPTNVDTVSPVVDELPGVGQRALGQVSILWASAGHQQRPQPNARILFEAEPSEPVARLTAHCDARGSGNDVSQS